MPDEFQFDVFFSHSSKDKVVVREVAGRLRKDGLKLSFDEWVLKAGGRYVSVSRPAEQGAPFHAPAAQRRPLKRALFLIKPF